MRVKTQQRSLKFRNYKKLGNVCPITTVDPTEMEDVRDPRRYQHKCQSEQSMWSPGMALRSHRNQVAVRARVSLHRYSVEGTTCESARRTKEDKTLTSLPTKKKNETQTRQHRGGQTWCQHSAPSWPRRSTSMGDILQTQARKNRESTDKNQTDIK